jgi:hypothetical protein
VPKATVKPKGKDKAKPLKPSEMKKPKPSFGAKKQEVKAPEPVERPPT